MLHTGPSTPFSHVLTYPRALEHPAPSWGHPQPQPSVWASGAWAHGLWGCWAAFSIVLLWRHKSFWQSDMFYQPALSLLMARGGVWGE